MSKVRDDLSFEEGRYGTSSVESELRDTITVDTFTLTIDILLPYDLNKGAIDLAVGRAYMVSERSIYIAITAPSSLPLKPPPLPS